MSVKVSCTDADRVDISVLEYNALVRDSEKIAAVKRFVSASDFVSAKDVMAILDIKREDIAPHGDNAVIAMP
jgi:hypothetical protein